MIPMTLSKFYMDGMILARKEKWRYGQALFNLLLSVRPELAESVRSTDMDPFYLGGPADDFDRWDRFATHIEKEWYKERLSVCVSCQIETPKAYLKEVGAFGSKGLVCQDAPACQARSVVQRALTRS